MRSNATNFGFADSSARITSSVGPANISIETVSVTRYFAMVTNEPPGPTILSTDGIDLVPTASAAIACAPPTLNIKSAPQRSAATRTRGSILPCLLGGVTTTIFFTPASFAGTIDIIAELGYLARPPGT